MISTIIVWVILTFLASLTLRLRRWFSKPPDRNSLPSLLIPSYTSHARLLPTPAKHSFSYPLIYLGVDIDSLEAHVLDISPLFEYEGLFGPFSSILGLRSHGYLSPGPGGLRTKLEKLLEAQGLPKETATRTWLLSMPSHFGFEGINPLSVWYLYNKAGEFAAVILEVHNTFGEKHAYVLPVDSPYKEETTEGYHHSWTFPRQFHVSPFNSRDGYYRLDLVDPFCSPGSPQVKVFLRLLTPNKIPKLQAVLGSHPTHLPIPIAQGNVWRMVGAVARWPLTLFLSTPRILYHAYKLHYDKKLAVYPRPEPAATGAEEDWNPPQGDAHHSGRAIGWQTPGLSEKLSRRLVLDWLEGQCRTDNVHLEIIFRDNRVRVSINDQAPKPRLLEITTADPKFFTNLVASRSPHHLLVLAPELLTSISNPILFSSLFAPPNSRSPSWLDIQIDKVRRSHAIFLWKYSRIAPPPDLVVEPPPQWTTALGTCAMLQVLLVVLLAYIADYLETEILHLVGAKFVEGHEPWTIWERALRRQYTQDEAEVASTKSQKSGSDDWIDLGSVQY